MNWEWVKVFISYVKKITKQYQLWALDLKCIIKSYAVKFAESEKKDTVDFKLQQQTLNILLDRKSVEYLQKKLITVKVIVSDQALTT